LGHLNEAPLARQSRKGVALALFWTDDGRPSPQSFSAFDLLCCCLFADRFELEASFGWLVASQPAVFFSHTSSASAISYQPASSIFLSQ
jgi:hypothetical protein